MQTTNTTVRAPYAQDLDELDITLNIKPVPRGSSVAFIEGWRAREHGDHVNPYNWPAEERGYDDWNAGNRMRAGIGFDYSHRIGSGTRLGPLQY